MGLDMYLYLRKYESDLDNQKYPFYPKELKELEDKIAQRNFKSIYTEFQVGYWRKANAIHKWFVDNCADGVDECQEIYVTKEKAEELLNFVNQILEDNAKAAELLPTESGFFFGSTEYDEWYYEDLKYTKELLSDVLRTVRSISKPHYSIIYQASW